MPNWCQNVVTLHHSDVNMINRAVTAYNEDKLFNEFVPCPPEEEENWYNWSLSNWGTKWEARSADNVERIDTNTIQLFYETAWAPPIEFYNSMLEQGFQVSAYYYEPGMNFCGHYDIDYNDEYSIDGNSEWVENNIPEDINDIFGISESMKEWEEEEDNDEE